MDKEEKNRYENFDNAQFSREVKNLEFKLVERILDN